MSFNSGVFLRFFAGFLLLYWLVRHDLRARNALIVVASYFFYGWWDYRFLSLIWISTLLDYFVGLALDHQRDPRRKTWILFLSLTGNLAILGVFKYFDFFVGSAVHLLGQLGLSVHAPTLQIVLPVGISFYTFQTMSYAIDVYRGKMKATRDLTVFAAYVSFFPQLVAGPIERASHLLPQFTRPLAITAAMVEEGIWLSLWGLFKKVVIADNLAPLVEMVYHPQSTVSGPAVVAATLAFGFQIYGDFSGYSDMARGLARMLGFDIMVNFNLPYAATNLRDFWHRWHVSLSTWLRDYLYISLGGNRCGPARVAWNLVLTFLLAGLWHGASWHFVLWGAYHGLGLAIHRGLRPNRGPSETPRSSHLSAIAGWLLTMLFVFYGWLLFRAGSLAQVGAMTRALGDWTAPFWLGSHLLNLAVFTTPLILMELWQFKTGNLLVVLTLPRWARAGLQGLILAGIILYWEKSNAQFIYFQF